MACVTLAFASMAMAAEGGIATDDENTMWGLIKKGGPVMIPLGIASILALALGLERFISLGKDRILPEAFVTEFGEAWGTDASGKTAEEVTESEGYFKIDRFISEFPGLQDYCMQAVEKGGVLPVVVFQVGDNDYQALVDFRNIETLEELAELQRKDPSNEHLYRLDPPGFLEPGVHRVVVVVQRKGKVWVQRLRIAKV